MHADRDRLYVERWFVKRNRIERMAGCAAAVFDALIETGAAPGIIYSRHPVHGWWSALSADAGHAPRAPPAGGENWYSAGAAWWLRRASLVMRTGAGPEAAAHSNLEAFVCDFDIALAREPLARLRYGACFCGETIDAAQAADAARAEWRDWISGAYGVCLRFFSAETCIAKESLARRIRLHFEEPGDRTRLDPLTLLALTQRLASLVLPFAPWERASGTPGLTIDRVLQDLGLGGDTPYEA